MYGIDEKLNYDARNVAKARRGSWPTYRRLLGYVFQYRARLAVSVVLAAFVALSFAGIIVGAGYIAKFVFESQQDFDRDVAQIAEKLRHNADVMKNIVGWAPSGLDDWAMNTARNLRGDGTGEAQMRAMYILCVYVIFMTIFGGVARFLQEYLSASIATFVTVALGKEMYQNVIRLPMRFFETRTSGEIIARMTNDTFTSGRGLTAVFMKLFREPFKALGCLTVALWIDPWLTLLGLGVLPPVALIMVKIGQSIRRRMRRTLERIAGLQTVSKEAVTGISIVKGFSMEDYTIGLVNREYSKLQRHGLKMMWADAAVGPLTEFVMMCGFVVFIILSARQVISGSLDVAELTMLYVSLGGMLDPVRKLTAVNNAVQTSVASAERVFEFIDLKSDIVDSPNAVELAPIRESLRFEDVYFAYDGRTDVLHGISFEVKKGEMVAIVGFSGAGKSTIVKLIPRFYDVGRGRIAIDGTDIRQVTQASLRNQISIVTQDTILFNETVRANIAAGKAIYTEERVREALTGAHALDFVDRLPYGMDTPIGESGGLLSGGQRQRLAIARALIKDPSILILDEATSSLDSESERAIQEALEDFVVGRTTIVIAHRLSTIQRADRILVINEGQVAEEGTHAELVDRPDSIYRRLYEVQFAVSERTAPDSVAVVAATATAADSEDSLQASHPKRRPVDAAGDVAY